MDLHSLFENVSSLAWALCLALPGMLRFVIHQKKGKAKNSRFSIIYLVLSLLVVGVILVWATYYDLSWNVGTNIFSQIDFPLDVVLKFRFSKK